VGQWWREGGATVSRIEFNRAAVGVSAKKDWADSDMFGKIGRFITTLPAAGVARELPAGDNAGVAALRRAAGVFGQNVSMVLQEYSDACAVLGSGQEAAIANYDVTEFQNTSGYRELVKRMGG